MCPCVCAACQLLQWVKNDARGLRLKKMFAALTQADPTLRMRAAVGLFYVRVLLLLHVLMCAQLSACEPQLPVNRVSVVSLYPALL